MGKFTKIIGIIFAVLIGLFILTAIFSDGEKSTTTDQVAEQQDAPKEEALVVTSKVLATDYEGNEVAADAKYKGKLLEVTGKVNSIQSDFSDDAMVNLNGKNEFSYVTAKGDDEFTKYATTLNKGQNVTLICRGDGEVIGSPSLKDCQPKP